jgi:sterol desaturase/sphingolipid hydroxylase (fatty acid hydroxylase superfamily)
MILLLLMCGMVVLLLAFAAAAVTMGLCGLVHLACAPQRPVRFQAVLLSFRNCVMVYALEIGFRRELYPSAPLHVTGVLMYILATECGLWLIHKTMHWPRVFKWVHRVHHQNQNPTAFDFAAVHPLEMLLTWGWMHALPVLVPGSVPPLAVFGYGVAIMLHGMVDHGRSATPHLQHHANSKVNFSVGLLQLD